MLKIGTNFIGLAYCLLLMITSNKLSSVEAKETDYGILKRREGGDVSFSKIILYAMIVTHEAGFFCISNR